MQTRVLVVDDDDDIGALISEVLAGEGYASVQAASADHAREVLATATFGLVISDSFRHMGGDAYAWLDEARTLTSAPIIIASAWSRTTYADYADHGFAALLQKPFDIADLMTAVGTHYDHARLRHAWRGEPGHLST
jgi:two-component system KDP operon response regulator KdpE